MDIFMAILSYLNPSTVMYASYHRIDFLTSEYCTTLWIGTYRIMEISPMIKNVAFYYICNGPIKDNYKKANK